MSSLSSLVSIPRSRAGRMGLEELREEGRKGSHPGRGGAGRVQEECEEWGAPPVL